MFLNIFSAVLLPLVLIAGLAFLLARRMRVNSRPLAQVAFYLFNPALAFVSLASTALAPEVLGRLVLLKVFVFIIMAPLARWTAERLHLSAAASSAFVLAIVFANSGNYGLSVNEYAFGQPGLALAVICYVTDNLLVNSIGVFIAARGHTSLRGALLQMLRNPALYTVILGLAAHQFGWQTPLPLWRGLETLGRAAVPTMLTVLGMQLATLTLDRRYWRAVGAATFARLALAPLIAIGLTALLGLSGLARQVAIAQTAPPAAVMTSIIASQYDTEPGLVASIVLVSSLASLITMTALLTWIS